jgi:hypothetical protein
MPRHSKDGICFKDRQSRYRARQVFVHCCLAVRAAAKVKGTRSASRALSVPVLNDRRNAKSTETTANDRLLNFMAQPPLGRKTRQVWSSSLKYSLSSSATASNSFLAYLPLASTEIPFVQTEAGPAKNGHRQLDRLSPFVPTADVIKEAANSGGLTFSKAASGLC